MYIYYYSFGSVGDSRETTNCFENYQIKKRIKNALVVHVSRLFERNILKTQQSALLTEDPSCI